jgi:eukaryotic-like serine/threonine-protein kinase
MTMMSLCHTCGAGHEAGALFCPQCGTACAATTHEGPDPMIGREVIGQYVISEKLGEGGMGAVYLADQPSVGRRAVVKVMHRDLSRDPSLAARFQIEARAASLLSHPHIVTIYNYGAMEDGTLFLAMEHCAGGSLDALLAEGPVPSERTARIGAQICDALAEAHRRGVVHRDLKPSNIMLTQVGRQRDFVKVLDFGIAKVEGVRMTRTGSIIGTPQYMSPEQFRGERLDGRSDLYSLGVLLYEMVTGRPLYESEGAAGYMHKHLEERPMPPRVILPELGIAPSLEATVLRALAKDRAARFVDADEMVRALEACVTSPQLPPTVVSSAAPRRRPLGLWLGVGGGAVVAAAASFVLVFGVWSSPRTPDAVAPQRKEIAWQSTATPAGAAESARAAGSLSVAPDAALPLVASKVASDPRAKTPTAKGKATRASSLRVVAAAKSTTPQTEMTDTPAPTPRAPAGATALEPTPPAPDPTPAPAPAPSASGDEARLLAELKRVMSTAKIPPSTYDSTIQGYHTAQANWSAKERDAERRKFLTQIINTYKQPSMQLTSRERQPLEKLRQQFLTMPTKADLSLDVRKRIYDDAVGRVDRNGAYPVKDRLYYKRAAILHLIETYASPE